MGADKLMAAAERGDLTEVRRLTQKAALKGHREVVEWLVEAGADVNKGNPAGWTPLYFASQNGHEACVRLLVEAGADVDKGNYGGFAPLHRACRSGHDACARLLVEAGAVVNKGDNKGAYANQDANGGWTPLHWACDNGHDACVRLLVEAGADVNKGDNDGGATPLHCACEMGHDACVRLLVEAGADVDKGNKNDATPLYIASQNGHEACVRLLVEAGADVNKARNEGNTPLIIASWNGHEGVTTLLLHHGADLTQQDNDGDTPLRAAEKKGHGNIVKLLREANSERRTVVQRRKQEEAERKRREDDAERKQREAEQRKHEEERQRAAAMRSRMLALQQEEEAENERQEEEKRRVNEMEEQVVTEAKSYAQSACDALVEEVRSTPPPEGFREAASKAMAGAAEAAGVMADGLSGALAHTGTVFPPAAIPAAFLKLLTLCQKIRKRYQQHMAILDKTLPDLRERVDALESGLKDLARLRILAKGPDALERLLAEADELCAKCLAEGQKGKEGFKAFAKRTWAFMRSNPKQKLELFQDMHHRLTQVVSDLAFLVQLRTYEANQATQRIAGEQRVVILSHLQRVDNFQQRLARTSEADRQQRNLFLQSLQQTAEATKRAAEAARDAAERNGDKLDEFAALVPGLKQLIRDGAKPSRAPAEEDAAEMALPADIPSSLLRPWSDVRDAADPREPLSLEKQPIGKGGFGVVFKAKLRCVGDSFEDVAVKMLDVGGLSKDDGEAFRREVAMQVQCAGHANVLGVRGVVIEPEHERYALIMDLCICSLHAVVHHDKDVRAAFGHWSWRKLSLPDKARKLLGVVEAVAFMHQMRVAHNDLKPENVLVHARSGSLVVTDFGLARTAGTISRALSAGGPGNSELRQHRGEDDAQKFIGGTLPYMAPEQLGPGAKVRREADVFALGALLFEALDKNPPQPVKDRKEALERAKQMQSHMDMEDLEEEEERANMRGLCALLRETWAVKRKQRPTVKQLSDRLVQLLADAEYAPSKPPVAGIKSAGSGAAVSTEQSSSSNVRTAAPEDISVTSPVTSTGAGTPQSSSRVGSALVAYAQATPREEWSLTAAAKQARIEAAAEALELETLADVMDVDAKEDGAELEDVKGPQRRRFLREVKAFQEFMSLDRSQ